MSNAEIETLDKLEDPDYWEYTLSEEGMSHYDVYLSE